MEEMDKATGRKIDATIFMTMLDTDKDGKVSIQEMQDALQAKEGMK